jgi:hypothetical protein
MPFHNQEIFCRSYFRRELTLTLRTVEGASILVQDEQSGIN